MRQDPAQRLMSHVRIDLDGCWRWTGARKASGYGQTNLDGVGMNAHRAAYIVWRGPVPQSLEIDHLCRVRECVNPDHLEAVTHAVNVRRGTHVQGSHCVNGHPRTPENAVWVSDKERGQRRRCRPCDQARESRRRTGAAA